MSDLFFLALVAGGSLLVGLSTGILVAKVDWSDWGDTPSKSQSTDSNSEDWEADLPNFLKRQAD